MHFKHFALEFSIPGLFILGLVVIISNSAAADLPATEKAPVMKAEEVLPPQLLNGKNYTIAPEVSMEGYLGNFTLNTEFGPLQVRGTELLQIRIAEIPAMKKLNEISKTEVFAKAAANAAVSRVNSLKKVAEDPVGTVKGIPAGVGRFFKKAQKTASKGVEAIKDSDTSQTNEGSSAGDAAKELAGVNRARREWAKNLNVDPYTTNPILGKDLDDVAWATFAGGLTTKVVLPTPSGINKVIKVSNLVWDLPPEDLEALNKQKLISFGVDESSTKAFLKRPHFTPTTQTALVEALEELKEVKGCTAVIGATSAVESEEEARFMIHSLSMLSAFRRNSPIMEINTSGLVITGKTSLGKMIAPAALDYVSWTDEVKEFALRSELKAPDREILLSGKFSVAAKQGLSTAGWKLVENYKLNTEK